MLGSPRTNHTKQVFSIILHTGNIHRLSFNWDVTMVKYAVNILTLLNNNVFCICKMVCFKQSILRLTSSGVDTGRRDQHILSVSSERHRQSGVNKITRVFNGRK